MVTVSNGRLWRDGVGVGVIHARIVVESDGAVLSMTMGQTELGNWNLDAVEVVGARFLMAFGRERWWFEPDDPETFVNGPFAHLGPREPGAPIEADRRRRSSVLAAARRFWRAYRVWRMNSTNSHVGIVIGGCAMVGIAVLIGSWPVAVLAAVGAGTTAYGFGRAVLARAGEDIPRRLDANPPQNGMRVSLTERRPSPRVEEAAARSVERSVDTGRSTKERPDSDRPERAVGGRGASLESTGTSVNSSARESSRSGGEDRP